MEDAQHEEEYHRVVCHSLDLLYRVDFDDVFIISDVCAEHHETYSAQKTKQFGKDRCPLWVTRITTLRVREDDLMTYQNRDWHSYSVNK